MSEEKKLLCEQGNQTNIASLTAQEIRHGLVATVKKINKSLYLFLFIYNFISLWEFFLIWNTIATLKVGLYIES